jgi:hypothetical protein
MKAKYFGVIAGVVFFGAVFPADADYIYTTIAPPNSTYTVALGVNNAGEVVGYYQKLPDRLIQYGFLYSHGL